jgi:hypothetical protein
MALPHVVLAVEILLITLLPLQESANASDTASAHVSAASWKVRAFIRLLVADLPPAVA